MTAEWPVHFSPEVVRQSFGAGKLSSYTLALEAWRRDLSVTFQDGDLRKFTVTDGKTTIRFDDARPNSITKSSDYRKLIRKWDTKRLLEKAGAPVPRGELLHTAETSHDELRKIADRIGYPLVIKPNGGTMGTGVFSNIRTWEQLKTSWDHLVLERATKDVLIEQHFSGDDYRVLVVGGEVLAACLRIPANVVGDGTKTIEKLINEKNKLRKLNPRHSRALIKVNFEMLRVLESQNLTIESVPKPGEQVLLRNIANAAAGGDVMDVTDELPMPIKDAAIQAVAAVPNIVVAGVDFIYQTGTAPTPDNFTIIEMNSRPHIPVNMYPTIGTGRDVPKAMMDYFFPGRARPDLPGDAMLNFDVHPFRAALRAGVVDSMTVKPLPARHYPVREIHQFPDEASRSPLPLRRLQALQKLANRHNVSGALNQQNGAITLYLAAEEHSIANKILREAEKLLGTQAKSSHEWMGVVTAGFRVNSRAV